MALIISLIVGIAVFVFLVLQSKTKLPTITVKKYLTCVDYSVNENIKQGTSKTSDTTPREFKTKMTGVQLVKRGAQTLLQSFSE